jgi:predicted transcriptional regulator
MLLQFPALKEWWNKRQQHLGWTNQTLAEKSNVPIGTIKRIKSGEEDCKYSTMRLILLALIGGTTDEFACTEQVEQELLQLQKFEQQAAKLAEVETKNKALIERISTIDEQHRNDIRAIKQEYQEQIAFLKDELKAWQSLSKKE